MVSETEKLRRDVIRAQLASYDLSGAGSWFWKDLPLHAYIPLNSGGKHAKTLCQSRVSKDIDNGTDSLHHKQSS